MGTRERVWLQEHLDVMFAADAEPLPWDAEGAYTQERIELYYLSNAAQPLTIDKLTEVRSSHSRRSPLTAVF